MTDDTIEAALAQVPAGFRVNLLIFKNVTWVTVYSDGVATFAVSDGDATKKVRSNSSKANAPTTATAIRAAMAAYRG
jgi:hypothetical protein